MPPLRNLAEALRLVRDGLRMSAAASVAVGGLAVLVLPVALLSGGAGQFGAAVGCCVGIAYVVAALVFVAGLVVGFVGRCRCARCPEEFPRARAAARLAVILESCGWLHLLSFIVVAAGAGAGGLSLPEWVPVAGLALSALLLIGGWAFTVVFCFRLAELTNEPTAPLLRTVPLSVVASALIVGGSFAYIWALFLWAVAVGVIGVWGLVVAAALKRLDAACEQFVPSEEP